MSGAPIYLDHNASTPPAVEVVEAMLPWLSSAHANPHSDNQPGHRAAAAVETARSSIAALIGAADPEDIYLTSGATESNNLILQGVIGGDPSRSHLLFSAIEHKCVLETAAALRRLGVEIARIPVDGLGRIDPAVIEQMVSTIGGDHCLISVMHSNNEIGTVQPIGDIAAAVGGSGALLHSDAAQSLGKVAVDVEKDGFDFLSLSAHKMYGPAGIGAAYIAREHRERIRPLMYGGGQQLGIRPGTIPVFLAVGFGVACDLALRRQRDDAAHCDRVASSFVDALKAQGIDIEELGDLVFRLPGLRSIRFNTIDADDLLARLAPWVSASTGSACSAGEIRASHVLTAIGLSADQASQVVRFGFGRNSTLQEAHAAAEAVAAVVRRISSERERS